MVCVDNAQLQSQVSKGGRAFLTLDCKKVGKELPYRALPVHYNTPATKVFEEGLMTAGLLLFTTCCLGLYLSSTELLVNSNPKTKKVRI